MSNYAPVSEQARPLRSALVCRLTKRTSSRGPSPTAGEVELENISTVPLEVEVNSSPLQYLDLTVINATGEVVSERFYGDLFSPLVCPYTLRLEPGERYTGPVWLLGNVPKDKQLPGTYHVQAVFEYEGLRAISEPLAIEV
jgi:hypothetical protein